MAANKENLIVPSSEEARRYGAKGGRASGEARRKKKALREIAEAIGAAKAPDEVIARMQKLGLSKKKNITLDEAIMLAQYGKALSGNVQSANFIADIKGEKTQNVNITGIDTEKSRLDELLDQRKAAQHESE